MELKLKTPWRDGTTHPIMSLLEFIQRLVAPKPQSRLRPRMNVLRRPNLALGCPVGSVLDSRHADHDGGEPSLHRDSDVPLNPTGEAAHLQSLVIALAHRASLDTDLTWMICTDSVRAADPFQPRST